MSLPQCVAVCGVVVVLYVAAVVWLLRKPR